MRDEENTRIEEDRGGEERRCEKRGEERREKDERR